MRVLVGLLVAVGIGGGAVYLLARGADGPIGFLPGGEFRGEIERGPEPDWSFAAPLDTVSLQIEAEPPRSVTTGIVVHDGVPYVPVTFAPLKRWQYIVVEVPRVLLRADGRLFERKAVAIEDPAMREALIAAGQAKYGPPFHATWAEPFIDFFRLEPRPASEP